MKYIICKKTYAGSDKSHFERGYFYGFEGAKIKFCTAIRQAFEFNSFKDANGVCNLLIEGEVSNSTYIVLPSDFKA